MKFLKINMKNTPYSLNWIVFMDSLLNACSIFLIIAMDGSESNMKLSFIVRDRTESLFRPNPIKKGTEVGVSISEFSSMIMSESVTHCTLVFDVVSHPFSDERGPVLFSRPRYFFFIGQMGVGHVD